MSRIPVGRPVGTDDESLRDAALFAQALAALRAVSVRPELVLEEVPAPTRLSPHAVALAGEVVAHHHGEADDPVATGRFVLLCDPTGPEPWEGIWRVVTYAKATMEPEVGGDPMVGEVGWSWLVDSVQGRGQRWRAQAGTVTAVSSQSFGALAGRDPLVELEIRASWTPVIGDVCDLTGHLQAWGDVLCTIAGLPPLPEGVVPLPGIRR